MRLCGDYILTLYNQTCELLSINSYKWVFQNLRKRLADDLSPTLFSYTDKLNGIKILGKG